MTHLTCSARCLALALACATAADAATTILTDTVGLAIPDGSSSGIARVLPITGSLETIVSMEVALRITASPGAEAFLGDLYVYMTNGTDLVVLINRLGRTATTPAGYGDNQTLDVLFSGTATVDIHNYRVALFNDAAMPLSDPLTGIWLPDGRTTDPANVLASDVPTVRFDVFDGDSANADWTLFVADLSGGGEHRLESWTLTLNTVPEPSSMLLSCLALPLLLRRRR